MCSRRQRWSIRKNEREVIIKDINYDANGPAAWFHAMGKGILGGVHAADESYYYTLPYPKNGDFNRVKGHSFNGEEITLILPVSIKKLGTIGLLCYRTCLNFGHVNIPPDSSVPAAPTQLPETKPCPKPPEMERCVAKGGSGKETKSVLRGGPNCEAGGPGPSPPQPPSPPGPEPVLTTPQPGSSNTSEVPKQKRMSTNTVLISLCVVFAVAVLIVAAIGLRVWSRRRHRVTATDANAVVVMQPDAL